jgi:hypothetical protein
MFIKKGKGLGLHGQAYQRYKCKSCGTTFSGRTLSYFGNFRKPELIEEVFTRYTSGYSIRKMAQDLNCNRETISKIIQYLGERIKTYHYEYISCGLFQTPVVAFDEMESFIHSKALPVAIGLAVCGQSGFIIDLGVAEIRMKGALKKKLSTISLKLHYLSRPNNSPAMRSQVLQNVRKCLEPNGFVISDAKPTYLNQVKKEVPFSTHIPVVSRTRSARPKKVSRINPYPKAMNRLNSVASQFRTYLSRLGRRTLITSKKKEFLEYQLWLFVAYRQYDLKTILRHENLDKNDFYERTLKAVS